jgi:hypothetical protein
VLLKAITLLVLKGSGKAISGPGSAPGVALSDIISLS